jgi:omega-6 fatty acid desaturase (delta-12 desaturase)
MQSTATIDAPVTNSTIDLSLNLELGGLKGLGLKPGKVFPASKGEVFAKIPKEYLKKDTKKSMLYAAASTVTTLMAGYLGFLIPQTLAMGPVWLAYAVVTGTLATGCWVVAHECGHDAFSENKRL